MAALPTAPAVVRAFVRSTLAGWHLDGLTEGAELIASELATNAVAASTDSHGQPIYASGHMPLIRVCLLTDGTRMLLEVWDQVPGAPVMRDAEDDESGRGLVLVGAIADDWGWTPAPGSPGKVVWAELSVSALSDHILAAVDICPAVCRFAVVRRTARNHSNGPRRGADLARLAEKGQFNMAEKRDDVARSSREPGGLMMLVASGLSAHGFDVRLPECEDGSRLRVSGADVRCELVVTDCGYVQWDCQPRVAEDADAKQIADIVTTLLTGQAGDYPRKGNGYDNVALPLKAVVALELKARSLAVNLDMCTDEIYYEATTTIVATNPAQKYAKATVDDDGTVIWERDYWPEAATIKMKPEYSWEITEPGKVAHAITETVRHAMTLAGVGGPHD